MTKQPVKSATRKSLSRRLVLGFAGVMTAATIGTAGIAAAQSNNGGTVPTNKADCVNWKQLGFKNRGQCVSAWEHAHNPGQGHGYGNGNNNTVNTNVNIDVNGNNNVIGIVINYLFG